MRTSMRAVCGAVALSMAASVAFAAGLSKKLKSRIDDASAVLIELHTAPDKDVPQELWDRASCVIVIPSVKKAAFVFGGEYGKGLVRAVLELKPDLWFFPCHFKGDPVMPGCLGLDALWQMLGFFLGWLGSPGKGRALGLGEVKFSGQVLPTVKKVVYGIDIKRVMRSKLVLGVADGWLQADNSVIYRASDLKVGLFREADALQPNAA